MLIKASKQLFLFALEKNLSWWNLGEYQMNMLEYQDTVVVFINRGKKPAAYVFSEVGPS